MQLPTLFKKTTTGAIQLDRLGLTADKVLVKSNFEKLIDFVNNPNS